jgi:methyl coenzyme M reductase subunit C-like uncharacterized protein (methanogenesis marker protein 7)
MSLTQSFWVEVQGVISDIQTNRFRSVNQWVPVHQPSKNEMEHQHKRQDIVDSPRNLFCVSNGLSVVIEYKEFVNPILDHDNEEVVDVKRWHT